jgi:hypothetical protein
MWIKNLVVSVDGSHKGKACLICDHLLEWNDIGYLTKVRLKALQNNLSEEAIRSRFVMESWVLERSVCKALKQYYSYNGKWQETWMAAIFLSPRGVFDELKGFYCCQTCCQIIGSSTQPYQVKLPKYAIANGGIIGKAPHVVLTTLNNVELSLVSMAQTDKHVFTFYGSAHKSMHGWHNLYKNDVEHTIVRVLQQVKCFGGGNTVACILQGPFTPYQQSKVREQVMIHLQKILKAMHWLKRNNRLYKELHILTIEELPEPIIIDDSELVESENTFIELCFDEYTVIFLGTEDINATNGGHMSQEVF